MLLDVDDVMKILKVPKSTGYMILRGLNEELKQKGFLTIRGRVPEDYLRERYNLTDERQ